MAPRGRIGGDRLAAALLRTAAWTLAAAIPLYLLTGGDSLTLRFFRQQDFPLLLLSGAALAALAWGRSRLPAPRLPQRRRPAPLAAAAALALALAGTWLVFGDYALSRDELLADFDAEFLREGLLVGPLPAEWRPFAAALMPQWMLPLSPEVGWMSGYLPGNAALRALLGPFTGPLMATISVLALHRIGRRLWPEAPADALVPVLLLVASAQFLAMAMTPYAMAAHLAFNLVWLACFLRGDRRGDAGALAAGFVATGLHQILLHPLFVAPFLLHLWLRGERGRAAAYVAAYAAIGLFWASWWQIVLAGAPAAEGAVAQSGIAFLWAKFSALLARVDLDGLLLMAMNLLRFVAWQHLLLVPFALLAWRALRRGEGIARPLAGGVLLTVATMLVLLPWQGHGWGYRYLHGLIGSLCLLGGYGWRSLAGSARAERRRGVLAAGTAFSLLALLPLHLVQAGQFVAPYRRAQAAIFASDADVVLVDSAGLLYAEDLVRNRPDLSNRPKVMDLNMLGEGQLRALCGRFPVEIFDRRHAERAGIPRIGRQDRGTERRALLRRLGCGAPIPLR